MTATQYQSSTPAIRPISESTRLYSPTQIACGTIGGPVGLIYFLWANFVALDNSRLAKRTLIIGSVAILAIIAIAPFLPEKGTAFLFAIIYIAIGRHIAEKYQMTKQAIADSPSFTFQSNWRVFLLGLLCLAASAVAVIGSLFLLIVLGVWQP
ncbi:hypothetical protein [Lysobacter sp. CFH 32150]|uniref:hypothetical protein n=1 Tax=Lysobacter sp. CFH 32150 TaxID=2927128 RepID=UPI001FA6B11C|nr:hypothetical protein [Lysobacter sp. CFH 32150]MCI4569501.1 hypothetical protein [Lysobacter sp. CFH 32150]